MSAGSVAVRRSAFAYAIVAAAIAVVLCLVLLVIGAGVVVAVLVALVAAAAAVALVYLRSDAMALKALGARRLEPGERPRLENLLDGLTVTHGFRSPDLCLVDDAAPNAAVVGRTPRHAAVVITSGLLERLERIELEGVLAHELSRIRSRQTLAAVTAATLIGRPLGLAPQLQQRLAARLVSGDAAVRADLAGTEATRYPPGLARALESMKADGRVVKRNPRAYRHLWINPPHDAVVEQSFSLEDRIDVLHEL